MKKTQKINRTIYAFLFLLSVNLGFSQKTIETPEYGMASLPGEITKIEILEDATVLHFNLTGRPGSRFSIPEGSCIKDVDADEKLFITKAEGTIINEWEEFPESGIANYKLFFPPLQRNVGRIDFEESNPGGTWYVYDIIIDEEKYASLLPKVLKGNWLKTDGTNAWGYSFNNSRAIIDKEIWIYKSVDKKRKKFTISLEKEGSEKTVYAKINKDNTVSFGPDKKQLETFSLEPTNTKDLALPNAEPYKESELFKMDSTTYSGILGNYSKRGKQKTGTIHVSNIFTGNQDSHLVKIKDDGSFTVKFPLYYPQVIYVRFPGYNGSVFVEPGKETWQLINSSKRGDVYFAGDLAQLNTDLASLQFFNYDRSYSNLQKKVKEISLEDYKKSCFKIHEKHTSQLDSVKSTRYLNERALQIMKLNLDYQFYRVLLSYDMYNRGEEAQIDTEYMSFLTSEIYNNKLAVLTSSYSSFLSFLRYSNPLRQKLGIKHPQGLELAELLKSNGVVFTDEEQELMIDSQLKFNSENTVALKKRADFDIENKEVILQYRMKFSKLYQKLSEADRKNIIGSNENVFDSIIAYAKPLDIAFTDDEIAVQKASKKILTTEEKEKRTAFYTKERGEKNKAFTEKYSSEIQQVVKQKLKSKELEHITKFFGDDASWMSDILLMRAVAGPILEELSPLSTQELKASLNTINNSFLAAYLVFENEKGLARIESNKSATGYVSNETPKTEADKIFEAIIDKYKGKVVFVDFWATWCGPCRSGMKKMIPLKEEVKDKDVVFVYITNPSSPQGTYNNMIPEIKGEHYRVSQDEWNYLGKKFNITGIPHYTLVNKEGKVVKDNTRDLRNIEALNNLFSEYLNE